MQMETKLIPVMRQGVAVIKMIGYKKIKDAMRIQYPRQDNAYINQLSAAIINELFGTPNMIEPFVSFRHDNHESIQAGLHMIKTELEELRIPLTDALRMQFLCDHQEGHDSAFILSQAQEWGILMLEREVPLPANFMRMVRKLGNAFNLLLPQEILEN